MKQVKVFESQISRMLSKLSKENKDLKARLKVSNEENKKLKKELEFYLADTMQNLTRINETLEYDIEKLVKHAVVLGIANEGER